MPDDQSSRRVLVIMPAWNEEGSVAQTVAEVRAANPDVDVMVVDDGSTDRTAERARAAGADVCQLPFNLGVGGAMRAGYRYAARHDYDVAVQIDADGQHDSTFLPALLDRLEGRDGHEPVDVLIGARFASSDDTYRAGGLRRIAMVMLAFVLSRMAGTRLTDVTSGYRLANRRALRLFAQHYPAEYLGDTVESLVIALRNGMVVRQVPVTMRVRQAGTASQSTAKAVLYLVRAVVALALALVRRWPHTALEREAVA